MRRARLLVVCSIVAAMLLPPVGRATAGRNAFAGAAPHERTHVTPALAVSSFDWDVVPVRVKLVPTGGER